MGQTLSYIVRTEGARSLWKGFTPYFVRSGGHTLLMFFFKEQVTPF
jgi:Mitochondrial carrier protein